MNNEPLPKNVYQLPQGRFKAISGEPWVYWINENVRKEFELLPTLGEIAQPKQGMATADNFRFLRYWWEVKFLNIFFDCKSLSEAKFSRKKWFPYMKGGSLRKWYGNQDYVVNWHNDGKEIQNFYGENGRIASRPQNTSFYFKEGITWSDLSAKGFGVRYLPLGFIFDVKGSSGFPNSDAHLSTIAIMNSSWMSYSLSLLNPTVSFQVGDISRVPFKMPNSVQKNSLNILVVGAIQFRMQETKVNETTFDFILPLSWETGTKYSGLLEYKIASFELLLDNEVFALYGVSKSDQEAIRADLTNGNMDEGIDEEIQENLEDEIPTSTTREELAARWISYAVGVVLGRFHPGQTGLLGSAAFRRDDFAKGSLPIPDEQEFEQLVGSKDRVAYIDKLGSWHMFPQQIEQALCDLALMDGIGVFSENHPSDLISRVRKALELMLGENGANELISTGADSDLRKFLEKDYFTNYHLKWYRKRPVYWYIQSSRRSYGFVIFHEKITKDTFYAIQRDPYLDTKRNAVNLEMQDVQERIKQSAGGERKKLEKRFAELRDLADELTQFAKDLEEITRSGYEPEPDWIDDGVILRMAPLWKVIPLWKSEPKKYWDALEKGEYDWSHIAMKYWPKRVREKCRKNKSFAIAHGHEEWYEGR